jgi:CheY-like chemotaxis protein
MDNLGRTPKFRVFISSTDQDLVPYRNKVAEVIERLGQDQARMEVFGARPIEPVSASLDELVESDALLGIYAYRYGHVPNGSDKSITEAEFDFAVGHGLPVFCFLIDEDFPWPPRHIEQEPQRSRLLHFKERISSQHVRETFTTPDDLALKAGAALGRFLIQRTVKMRLEVASQTQGVGPEAAQSQVARRAQRLSELLRGARILLVNDVPSQMQQVIEILRELGVDVTVARSTEQAVEHLDLRRYHAVVSDMRRGRVADAGLELLVTMRRRDLQCPTIFTVGQYRPELGTPPFAFGITNRGDELLNLLFDAFERTRG